MTLPREAYKALEDIVGADNISEEPALLDSYAYQLNAETSRNGSKFLPRPLIEAPMPVLITASNEIGELRSPSMKEIIAAQKKNVSVWNANDLGVDPARLKRTKLLQLFQPFCESNCEIVGGGSPEEAAVNLALKLKETKIL